VLGLSAFARFVMTTNIQLVELVVIERRGHHLRGWPLLVRAR
jgi:hypothetical protein